MKKTVMVYCGENGMAGKALALERNDDDTSYMTASGFEFAGVAESETCIIMPDLPSFKRNEISAAYGGKVELIKDDDGSEPSETQAVVHKFGPPPELAKLFTTPEETKTGPAENLPYPIPPKLAAEIKRKRGRPRKVAELIHDREVEAGMNQPVYNETSK